MEAPARGMLRRPVGLLPSATTRAGTAPERMGHVAHAVVPAEPARATSTLTSMETAGCLVTEIGGAIARAHALPMEQHLIGTLPMGTVRHPVYSGIVIEAVQASLPWATLAQPTSSFGITVSGETMISSMAARSEKIAAARAETLARKQVTHWKCLCCRAMMPKAGGKQCTACGHTQADASQLAISEREEARAASRANTKKGRRRNGKRGANVPQHSLSVAPVSAFEREWQVQLAQKKQRIETETEELAMERCGLGYIETEDARAAVMESFMQV